MVGPGQSPRDKDLRMLRCPKGAGAGSRVCTDVSILITLGDWLITTREIYTFSQEPNLVIVYEGQRMTELCVRGGLSDVWGVPDLSIGFCLE